MKRIVLLFGLALVASACAPEPTLPGGGKTDAGYPVYYYHDTVHAASCWLFGSSASTGKAISCLPDSVLAR